MDASKAAALGIIPLDQLYLAAICQAINSESLSAVLQDFGNDQGRLWLVRENTTTPEAFINFAFAKDAVAFEVTTRSERTMRVEVRYGEGVDGFLETLVKFLQAGRIAAPKRRAA